MTTQNSGLSYSPLVTFAFSNHFACFAFSNQFFGSVSYFCPVLFREMVLSSIWGCGSTHYMDSFNISGFFKQIIFVSVSQFLGTSLSLSFLNQWSLTMLQGEIGNYRTSMRKLQRKTRNRTTDRIANGRVGFRNSYQVWVGNLFTMFYYQL